MPGSADGGKSRGRACMVPGKMRSQSGGKSTPLEEEGLFHTALSFTTVLVPSLTWACQVPGRMPVPHVTEGKLCFKNLQWHRTTGVRGPVVSCSGKGPYAQPSRDAQPLDWGQGVRKKERKSLSGGARRHLFLTWTMKHFQQENEHIFSCLFTTRTKHGIVERKWALIFKWFAPQVQLYHCCPWVAERDSNQRFYMCFPSLPRFLHSWAGNIEWVLGKGLWVGSWGVIFRLRFLRVALLSPSFSSLLQTGQGDHWHGFTRDKRAMTFMTFIRLCTRDK